MNVHDVVRGSRDHSACPPRRRLCEDVDSEVMLQRLHDPLMMTPIGGRVMRTVVVVVELDNRWDSVDPPLKNCLVGSGW